MPYLLCQQFFYFLWAFDCFISTYLSIYDEVFSIMAIYSLILWDVMIIFSFKKVKLSSIDYFFSRVFQTTHIDYTQNPKKKAIS